MSGFIIQDFRARMDRALQLPPKPEFSTPATMMNKSSSADPAPHLATHFQRPPIATSKEIVVEPVNCVCADTAPPLGSFDNLVIVLVGHHPKKKEFQVHRGLLTHNSFTFEHILKNDANDDIKLPTDDPAIFETVLYWMYTARFWASKTSKDGRIPLEFSHILRVYFFAADNGMLNLQNAAMTLIYQKTVEEWRTPIAQADLIYNKTTPTAPLRRFLIDFVADAWSFDFEATQGLVLPNGFLIDVLVSLREMKKAPGTGTNKAKWVAEMNKGFCGKYHDHED